MIGTFRVFRSTRPFWGGLFTLVSGAVIALLPLGPLWYYLHAGVGAIMGEVIGVGLLAIGALTWLKPDHHRSLGPLSVGFALIAFPMTNLGGLIVGTIAGIVGGAMTFGWAPPGHGSAGGAVPTEPLSNHEATAERDDRVVITAPAEVTAAPVHDPAAN